MLSHFIVVQYCYEYLINQISIGLLLYSHLPVALTALAFSIYVLVKAKNLPSILLFSTCFTFTIWCALDLSAWFSFLGSANTMFVWSLLDFLAVLMFLFGYYFLYTFTTGKDLPLWQKIVGVIAILPTSYVAFSGLNIPTYDLNSCAAFENGSFTIFAYYTEAFFILAALIFVIFQYRHSKEKVDKRKTLLTGIGVLIFLTFFFSASFLVSELAASSVSLYVYNYLIYGLFGMPIFLIYLGYLIVRYHAFDLRVFAAQALSIAIITLVAAQYAFLSGLSSIILNSVNLVLVAVVSIYLTRNVKREISLREDLEIANKGQENLIHVMNHQIKGFLGTAKAIFAELLQSRDYGQVPDEAKPLLKEGLVSMSEGVDYVQGILHGASAQDGTLQYDMKPIDIKSLVSNLAPQQKEAAEKSPWGLSFELHIADGDYNIIGDGIQLTEAFKNLITNGIKYNNPHGSIKVDLTRDNKKIMFSVKDAGDGVSEDVKPRLFMAGGISKDSAKKNPDTAGYGLAFVKGVIEAHKGTVGYKPNDREPGTTFFATLPVNKMG